MKLLLLGLLIVSTFAIAHNESKAKNTEDGVEALVKKSKNTRKKKVEMCHECGKPEVNCDCKGEEHRKGE
jgi:hypothetical protein